MNSATINKTILVVDDEEIVRDLLRYALSEEGYNVLTAENGFEALDIIRNPDCRCNLAIIDFSMPGMDGIELSGKIRAELPEQKVMMSTGSYSTEEEISELKKKGIADVIRKPFNIAELLVLIEKELGCQ